MLTGQSLPNLKGSLTLCILMSYIDHFQLLLATRSAAVWAKSHTEEAHLTSSVLSDNLFFVSVFFSINLLQET